MREIQTVFLQFHIRKIEFIENKETCSQIVLLSLNNVAVSDSRRR